MNSNLSVEDQIALANAQYGFKEGNSINDPVTITYSQNCRTWIERTKYEIVELTDKLERKKELLKLLENNPDISRIFDLLR